MDIKITKDCFVPKENIKLYINYSVNSIKRMVKDMKSKGLVMDLTNGKKTETVIFLNTGEAITTNTRMTTLIARMDPQSAKAIDMDE